MLKLKRYSNHFILDDILTWPTDTNNVLIENEEYLRKYKKREKEIDSACQRDELQRFNTPINEYKELWESTISQITESNEGYKIIGFHCSRYIDEEIENIICNGLHPLNSSFLKERIERLYLNNLIDLETTRQLQTKNKAEDNNRKDKICFFHSVSTLKKENDLIRLFRAWGGEALYWHYEKDTNIFEILNRIGKPCIVVASCKINELHAYTKIEEKMIDIWLSRKSNYISINDINTSCKINVNALEIIQRKTPLFENLTCCNSWRTEI